MKILFSVILLLGALYFVWWGYKHLLRRERDEGEVIDGVACQICRQGFPREEVVTVEKAAGFENYFCGNCIARLAAEYNELVRQGAAPPVYTDHTLDGNDEGMTRYN